MRLRVSLFTLVGALGLMGCAGHAAHTLEARSALDARNPKKALELMNEQLEVESGSELPEKTDGDNALFLLDRSLISQQLSAYRDSSRDLEAADKAVEMLDFTRSTADEIGRYLFSDDVGEYKARPFEKLLINTMNMVNYLAQGNLQGAKIEARRFAIMQKYLRSTDDAQSAALLGPGSYLAGFTFERANEVDEAIRFYDEALAVAPYPSLREPVQRLSQRTGYTSPRLKEVVASAPPPADITNTGEVLLVVSYGRVPALKAERIPIGLAITYASLFMNPTQMQGARRAAGQGLVTWVNYPSLEPSPKAYGSPTVTVDGVVQPADQITRVDDLVRAAYDKARGPILASAIIRMVARAAVGAGVGVGVGQASDNAAAGMLAALVTQAALVAADTPDTRSWATLPARIALVRVRLPAGPHKLTISAQGRTNTLDVVVAAGGFQVASFTELSQK